MRKHSVKIPTSLATDPATVRLITQWRNLLSRHAQCRKRVNWKDPKASEKEKARRSERWVLDDRINTIERTLLLWIAKATKHPDLFMDKKASAFDPLDHRTFSVIYRLTLDYASAKQRASPQHAHRNLTNAARTQHRQAIVKQIRDIEWSWMRRLYHAVYPDRPTPIRRPLARTLRPRYQRKVI